MPTTSPSYATTFSVILSSHVDLSLVTPDLMPVPLTGRPHSSLRDFCANLKKGVEQAISDPWYTLFSTRTLTGSDVQPPHMFTLLHEGEAQRIFQKKNSKDNTPMCTSCTRRDRNHTPTRLYQTPNCSKDYYFFRKMNTWGHLPPATSPSSARLPQTSTHLSATNTTSL